MPGMVAKQTLMFRPSPAPIAGVVSKFGRQPTECLVQFGFDIARKLPQVLLLFIAL
jgi:hypothetical protein